MVLLTIVAFPKKFIYASFDRALRRIETLSGFDSIDKDTALKLKNMQEAVSYFNIKELRELYYYKRKEHLKNNDNTFGFQM